MRAIAERDGVALVSGVHLRWAESGITDSRRALAWDLLTPAERARWGAIVLSDARERFLLGRLLLRQGAAELSGIPVDRVVIRSECPRCGGPHGRPIIDGDGVAALHASLSSTSGLVVAAFLPARLGRAVGVDMEAIAGSSDRAAAIDDLVPRVGRTASGPRAALRRWTRAEAVLKADGRALRVDPSRVIFRRVGHRLVASVDDDPTSYVVTDRRIGRRAILSVAVAVAVARPGQRAGADGSSGSAAA